MNNTKASDTSAPTGRKTNLSADAKNALAEAKARQAGQDAATAKNPIESGGRGGLDPARYGDWEIKGITSDF